MEHLTPPRTLPLTLTLTQEQAHHPGEGSCAPPAFELQVTTERSRWSLPLCPGQPLVVGSSAGADLRLEDPFVSALHCCLTWGPRGLRVEDLESEGGTWVGGTAVALAHVPPSTPVRAGSALLSVEPRPRERRAVTQPLPELLGAAPPMLELAERVRRVAPLRLPVLLRGESGTGKELVARALHRESGRTGPFVAVNAATLSRDLAESELFGHERGAFTGATRDRRGAFREAHKGTLFLDELGALPSDVQAKLLRAVEEKVVRPLGAEASVKVDVRILTATCEPLEEMVRSQHFRADLHERLAVCVLELPALRQRREDIPLLASHLLAESELRDRHLSPGALSALQAYSFPGNVRELRNVVVQAALLSERVVQGEVVRRLLAARGGQARPRLEPEVALHLVREAGGNVSAAARRASIPRSTLRDLLRGAAAGE